MTSPPGETPAPNLFEEDLRALAEYAFRYAIEHCRGCKGYHALWVYERLAGVKSNSFETERDLLQPLLLSHTPQRGEILIAGAADSGLLAFTARATFQRRPRITVADRCPTPLAVCRRYAESPGLDVATAHSDLTASSLPARFHLAFAHNVLMMIPLASHAAFLSNIRRSLVPGGTLILVNRVREKLRQVEAGPKPHYASEIMAGLNARGIPFPEPRDEFCGRLSDYSEAQKPWSNAVITLDDVESALAEAGFHIRERIEHDRRRSIPARDGGAPIPMMTYIFIATPQS